MFLRVIIARLQKYFSPSSHPQFLSFFDVSLLSPFKGKLLGGVYRRCHFVHVDDYMMITRLTLKYILITFISRRHATCTRPRNCKVSENNEAMMTVFLCFSFYCSRCWSSTSHGLSEDSTKTSFNALSAPPPIDDERRSEGFSRRKTFSANEKKKKKLSMQCRIVKNGERVA